MKAKQLLKTMKVFTKKHSPEILTGIGIAGMITTTVLAVKATPNALVLLEDAEFDKKDETGEELTVPEKIKVCWRCYIPATITGIASVTCIIGASSVNAKRNAALATAYSISQTALTEYKEKVVETIGEKKEKVVRQKVAQSKVDKQPVSNSEVIITEKGNTRFFEPLSGRYFDSDIETVRRIVNELNKRMIGGEQYISLSEFYNEIGLKPTNISDRIGWRVDVDIIEIDFPAVKDENGKPCLSLDYLIEPTYDFDKIY